MLWKDDAFQGKINKLGKLGAYQSCNLFSRALLACSPHPLDIPNTDVRYHSLPLQAEKFSQNTVPSGASKRFSFSKIPRTFHETLSIVNGIYNNSSGFHPTRPRNR